MKNLAKLIVVTVFGLGAVAAVLNSSSTARFGSHVFASGEATPTPPAVNKPANIASAVNAPVNANTAKTPVTATGGKTIKKAFTLGQDSQSEHGEVAFNHENHAFKNYSPDGKSVVGCVECHHTDQPKAALKPPLVTSERNEVLTFESWTKSSQKVSECRTCHFQDGNVPDNKTMPEATYTVGGKSKTKIFNNELAYHENCNTCHDAAFRLRPEVKKSPGFATANDCAICHKTN